MLDLYSVVALINSDLAAATSLLSFDCAVGLAARGAALRDCASALAPVSVKTNVMSATPRLIKSKTLFALFIDEDPTITLRTTIRGSHLLTELQRVTAPVRRRTR